MEGGPGPEVLEQSLQPNLLAIYAEHEVEIFGMTGTLQDLAEMCPVDLSDPRVTIEAKNEFVVKAANEGGVEILPEHQPLFDKVIQKHGLESKYVVKEQEKPTVFESIEKPVPVIENMERVSTMPESNKPAKAEIIDRQRHAVNVELNSLAQEASYRESTESSSEAIEPIPTSKEATLKDSYDKTSIPKNVPDIEKIQQKSDQVSVAPLAEEITIQSNKSNPTISETQSTIEISLSLTQEVKEPIESEVLSPSTYTIPDNIFAKTNEHSQGVLIDKENKFTEEPQSYIEAPLWADEISKEPEEIFEDFLGALQFLCSISDEAQKEDTDTIEEDNAPPIVVEVTEQLAALTLEEKEEVAIVLQNIVGAFHGISLLEERNADSHAIKSVEKQIEALCISLFDSLNLTYTDLDLEQFIATLHRHEFQALLTRKFDILDLEERGTHEAKWQLSRLHKDIRVLKDHLHQALGGLALIATS